jgi:uncharacterized damage-inducible protein DinB
VLTTAIPDPKEQFLDAFAKEHQTTLRVLKALPEDKGDLKPHAKCKSARELAWVFVMEMGMARIALTTGFDWSKPFPATSAAPDSMAAIIDALDGAHQGVAQLVRDLPADKLGSTVQFPSGPGAMADVPVVQFLWFLLCDQIHHRGQFSIYLRMADAKVPSIYGPTLDEPWM